MVYERDYDAEDMEIVRQYGKQYLTEAFEKSLRSFNNSMGSLSDAEYNIVVDFVNNQFDKTRRNYVNLYLDAIPESMSEIMTTMIKVDSVFTNSKKADKGAFTTTIGDISFCYFGPGYFSSSTVIHEAGHYYASRFTDLGAIPLDLAETHSQGNEWLFVHFLKDYILPMAYDALINYRLYSDLNTIMLCLMIDEFESRIYSMDVSNFTAADFDAVMESVVTQYFKMSYVNENMTDINAYWRAVVVDQPVYYISYGVSAMASIGLYSMAVEDFDAALAAYQTLCENPQEDLVFLGNIAAVGLNGPFDEEFYIELMEILNSRS
jgi:hypothetical protein